MGFESSKKNKKISLKDIRLLSSPVIARLIKANIRNIEELYWSIQKEPQKVSEIIEIDIGNTYALGTLLLDWIDEENLKYWAHLSLSRTGSPIKLDYQQKI